MNYQIWIQGLLIFLGFTQLYAQQIVCLDGDCENGYGRAKQVIGSGINGIYEGEFVDGKFHGEGIFLPIKGGMYKGSFKNNKHHGQGILADPNGAVIVGIFEESIMVDTLEKSQLLLRCLEGDCNNGVGRLQTLAKDIEISTYKGEFWKGKFHGKGKLIFMDGHFYDGYFKNGLFEGQGVLIYPDGSVEAGEWEANKLDKRSEDIKASLLCLEGNCKNGCGTSTDYKGRKYTGNFKNGKYEGYGKMLYSDGSYYEGEWVDGLPHGAGKHFLRNGHTIEGPWERGRSLNNDTDIFAVVVGVADYQHFNKLTYTIDDAKRFHAFLQSPQGGAVPEENLVLLLDSMATRANIINSMFELYSNADSNDLVIFYFAGHGMEGMFLPVDYQKEDPSTYLHHALIVTEMNDCEAKFCLAIADACHSGSMVISYDDYKRNGYKMPPMTIAGRTQAEVRQIIAQYKKSFKNVRKGFAMILSSATEEISLETNKFKQGVFSYYLINGLKGYADANSDKIITVNELADFVEQQVMKFTYKFQQPQRMGLPDLKEEEREKIKTMSPEEQDEYYQAIRDQFMNSMPVGFNSMNLH